MTPVWAQRREEMWSDCLVSPDVFHEMVDRLGEFVMPSQQALETEADPHSMHLSLQGLTITHNFCALRERPKGQVVDHKKGAADNTL